MRHQTYCDPAVISQVDEMLRDYDISEEYKNKIKDIIYYGCPMRAHDSFKQHVEFAMAVMHAFTYGYEYTKAGGEIIKQNK